MTISLDDKRVQFAILSFVFICSLLFAVIQEQIRWIVAPFVMLVFLAGWQQGRSLFYLLLCSIPFSFEYNFTPSLGTDIPDEGLMVLVTFISLAWWIYDRKSIALEKLRHPLIFLLAAHIAWIMISVILSSDPVLSLKYLVAKSWYIGSFVLAPLLFIKDKKFITIAAIVIGCSILAVAMIALLKHGRDGFSFAAINESVAPFFRNHVNYSSMLVCAVPLFIAFYQLAKNRNIKLLCGIALLILLVALFYSYARGGWLALGTGLITYWLLKRRLLFYSYLLILLLALASFFWLRSGDRYMEYAHDYNTTIFHEDFQQHLIATYQLKDVSTAERFYRWIAAVRMVKDEWVNGYGPNTFYDNYKSYTVPAYKTWVSDNRERSTVHNYFLLLATEQGIPGLVIFLLLLGAMFFYAQRIYIISTDPFYRIVAATLAAILVMICTVNFLSDLIETDKIGSLFFLSLAMMVIIERKSTLIEQL